MKVVIVSLEHVNRDYSLSGGALRVAGITDLLKEAGHDVTVLRKTREDVPFCEGEKGFEIYKIREDGKIEHNLNEELRTLNPECVIVEQWGLIDELEKLDCPLICDFHGSLIWENSFRGYTDRQQILTKLYALQKCDGFLVPGERQYYYFLAWAMMAGVPMQEDRILQLKLHLPRDWYDLRGENNRNKIVCGGGLWPWVNMEDREALKEAAQNLNLRFEDYYYKPAKTGLHPGAGLDASSSGKSHYEIVQAYQDAALAFDCYHLSRERQLAITTRTVEYLYCGIPVIYSRGLELSRVIEELRLGVVTNSVTELIQNPEDLKGALDCSEGLRERLEIYLQHDKSLEDLSHFLKHLKPKGELEDTLGSLEEQKREYRRKAKRFEDEANYFRKECERLKKESSFRQEEKQNYRELFLKRSLD